LREERIKEALKMSKNILVIDDDEAIRKSFVLTFEDSEYQIDTAESGEIGLIMRQKSKYDLIFIDLKMPGINGVEVLMKLRKKDKNVPIYIITAFDREFFEQLKSAGECGLDFEVLRKPVDSEQLVLMVKGILERPTAY